MQWPFILVLYHRGISNSAVLMSPLMKKGAAASNFLILSWLEIVQVDQQQTGADILNEREMIDRRHDKLIIMGKGKN